MLYRLPYWYNLRKLSSTLKKYLTTFNIWDKKKYKEEKYICLKIYPIEYKKKIHIKCLAHTGDKKKKLRIKSLKIYVCWKNEIKILHSQYYDLKKIILNTNKKKFKRMRKVHDVDGYERDNCGMKGD